MKYTVIVSKLRVVRQSVTLLPSRMQPLALGVLVAVAEGVKVLVAVAVKVGVKVRVAVGEDVGVKVAVAVLVAVGEGV